MGEELTPELLLQAYRAGFFPMADGRHEAELYWYKPEERGIIPLETFHIPRSLRRLMRHCPFDITVNRAFADVIAACAQERTQRPDTWINNRIQALYTQLHHQGHAHSVECWRDGRLVGGLYGVQVGAAFCGESMFSYVSNASRVALVVLVERLHERGFTLLDCQYVNEHLRQFGCVDIPAEEYEQRLMRALESEPVFD